MKNSWPKWPRRFGFIYGIVLAVFTLYVLLNTFVIPQAMVSVGSVTAAANAQSSSKSEITADDAEFGAAESTDSSDAVVTDTSYKDDNISISYTTERISDTTCYIVDIQVSDISYLKTAFAQGTYGRNIRETTSDMAEENSAILAINGDYYGFRDYGYVLRNGTLYRDTGGNDEDLVIDADGTMRIIQESEISAAELKNEGVRQVFSFGPALVNDGEIVVGQNDEVAQSMTSNPRTAIGMISPLHYIIVVSDGRTEESAGLTLYELAQVFAENGATVAYNLDGGGSSTLWFNGKVINNPAGGRSGSTERKVSDIIYFSD